MKTIVAGGRDFTDFNFLSTILDKKANSITEIVCGGAKGADAMGKKWAELRNVPVKMFPADWKRYGRGAGPKRNTEMANYAEQLIAFWDGESKGTKHMINQAKKLGLEVQIINY